MRQVNAVLPRCIPSAPWTSPGQCSCAPSGRAAPANARTKHAIASCKLAGTFCGILSPRLASPRENMHGAQAVNICWLYLISALSSLLLTLSALHLPSFSPYQFHPPAAQEWPRMQPQAPAVPQQEGSGVLRVLEVRHHGSCNGWFCCCNTASRASAAAGGSGPSAESGAADTAQSQAAPPIGWQWLWQDG